MGEGLQVQSPDPPIPWIGSALHHAARFQPVDQPRDSDRLDIQELRQFLLRQPRLTFQPDQDAPLCTGHPVRPGTFVGMYAQQARDVMQKEQKIPLEVLQWETEGGDGSDNKPPYHKSASQSVMRRLQGRCARPAWSVGVATGTGVTVCGCRFYAPGVHLPMPTGRPRRRCGNPIRQETEEDVPCSAVTPP